MGDLIPPCRRGWPVPWSWCRGAGLGCWQPRPAGHPGSAVTGGQPVRPGQATVYTVTDQAAARCLSPSPRCRKAAPLNFREGKQDS